MAEPLVTAAIPVRDGEAYLAEAIESVLGQTRPCDQLIVVDNGSSDRSAEIARGFGPPVEVVSEPRAGIGFARNAAVGAARGDFIAFLDADDLWTPAKTELQLTAFAARPQLQPRLRPRSAVRQSTSWARPSAPPSACRPSHSRACTSARCWPGGRRSRRLGPGRRTSRVSDGLTFLLGARELGLEQAMLPEVVMLRRVHGANTRSATARQRTEFARLLKGSLDRRRGAAQ